MKVLFINSFFSVGGPPRIVSGIYETLISQGHEAMLAAGREKPIEGMNIYKIGTGLNKYCHYFMSVCFDSHGFASKLATRRLVRKIKEYKPDIIHLHNVHGYYLNIEILFNYIKKADIPVVWTLHDCWCMTGHCSHFEYVGCDRWRTDGCRNCPQKAEYPKSAGLDRSKTNFIRKKRAFCGVKNMTIVTPSRWLAEIANKSFLKEYDIRVIHNGLDTEKFMAVPSDLRQKHGLENKKVILGVAQNWGVKKGLEDFFKLAGMLDETYQIVLIGLTQQQIEMLPANIIGLPRTNTLKSLLQYYTMADVFVNLTYEDTFPTVNLEALCCGLPVVTYKTGGSPESLDEKSGICVEQGNLEAVVDAIAKSERLMPEDCRARAKDFQQQKRYFDYIELYRNITT
ncbi:MAG: glycosyltransferase [Clostridia bacterium]|nr:glycosyltransferase [Clostridia bacterium]